MGRYKVRSLMKALTLNAKRPKAHRSPASRTRQCLRLICLIGCLIRIRRTRIGQGDITYIRTQLGWLYLAMVLDLYSRRVVSWASQAFLTVN